MKVRHIRSGQCFEQVTESLAVSGVQQSAERPDETEEEDSLDVLLSSDLYVVGQHRRQQGQAGLKHAHLTQVHLESAHTKHIVKHAGQLRTHKT